jgi:hypothetical protein
MEGKFIQFVIEQLETLADDLRAGIQPSNLILHTVVMAELRKQYGKPQSEAPGE